jgi:hypothetical protein
LPEDGHSGGNSDGNVAAARPALCQTGRLRLASGVQRRVENEREKGLPSERGKSDGRSRSCGRRARFCQKTYRRVRSCRRRRAAPHGGARTLYPRKRRNATRRVHAWRAVRSFASYFSCRRRHGAGIDLARQQGINPLPIDVVARAGLPCDVERRADHHGRHDRRVAANAACWGDGVCALLTCLLMGDPDYGALPTLVPKRLHPFS